MRKALFLVAVGAAQVVTSPSALAHHAAATYDAENPITIGGVVTDFKLASPHTQIFFDAKDAQGNVVSWVALSGPPQRLYRSGWRSDTLKAGDKITITGTPSKDGKKYMGVVKVVGPDGTVLAAQGE